MHLYLIGFRACGKTTVALQLAKLLDRAAVDLDKLIVERAQRSIAEIFSRSDETCFRELESQLLSEVANGEASVVSLGGGAILDEPNRNLISTTGKVVWLRASAQSVLERMDADPENLANRPPLSDLTRESEVHQQLLQRSPIYAACADYTIDTDQLTPPQVAEEISNWWNSVDTNNSSG